MRLSPDRLRRRSAQALPERRAVDVPNLRRIIGHSALTVTVAQTATAALALRKGRRDYADAVWGPGLASVAVGRGADGSRGRPAALGPGRSGDRVGGAPGASDARPDRWL